MRAVLLFFFSIVSQTIIAQDKPAGITVTGMLKDSVSGKPVPYATVAIYDSAQQAVASTYSQESGQFVLTVATPGRYRGEISFVGYRRRIFSLVSTQGQPSISLNTFLLQPGDEVLQEVIVSGRRLLVDQKPGMLIYNAEQDISNKGGTAADVLRKAPVLQVDAQGNVSMRGSQNIKILINGKYSGQMARSPADALNMIPAAMIRSVEIITTPSAKYDAEGAAGVINIITKKGRSDWSGTLEASASNLEQMFNPRLSISTSRLQINLAGHLHRFRSKTNTIAERTSLTQGSVNNILKQEIRSDNAAPHGSADLAIDYAVDSISEISFGANTWFGKWPEDNQMLSQVFLPNGNVSESYRQFNDKENGYLGIDMTLAYTRRFKKAGQELTILGQHAPSRDRSRYDARSLAYNDELLYREKNSGKTRNREWTAQVDYIHPLSRKGTTYLETGAKMILRHVANRYAVFASDELQADVLIPQPDRTDEFKYKQDVLAGYAILKLTLKNGWYVEAGSRLEATYLDGEFVNAGNRFTNDFLNLVPTATVSKKINEFHSLSVSYTQRLTRPYIWDLNPNSDASDPKNIRAGNPALRPELAHQAEISYAYNTNKDFFLTTALFARQTDNAIVEFTEVDANGIAFISNQNLAANRQVGLNASATNHFSDRLTANANYNLIYAHFDSDALSVLRSGWGHSINVNSTLRLRNRYSLQAFGEYSSRQATLLGSLGRNYQYSLAAKKEIKKAKVTITIAALNFLSNYINQVDRKQGPGFGSMVDNQYYNRAFKLTLNWEFGRPVQEKERKKVDNSDVNVQGKG